MAVDRFRNHPDIEMQPRCWLRPNPTNARKHNRKQIELIACSMDKVGFIVPIIADDTGLIVAGHARWAAAGLRGIEEVPVIRVRFVSEADRRAFSLADNKLAELAEWDEELLAKELEFLFEQDYDFSFTGFDLGDLKFGVPGASPPEPPVELPDPNASVVSRLGDLWLVGPHRIYCGNARDAASYEALLGDERAAMIICDPPYNVPMNGHVSGLGQVRHREFLEASGEMTPAEFTAFLRAIFRNCVRFAANGSIHYQFMDWRHIREILDAADGVYTSFKQLAVWAKDSAGMGTFYRSQHELVFIFKSGTARHINNFGLGEGGRYRTNLWTAPGANGFRKGRMQDLADHGTIKPTELIAEAMLDCSHRGDVVLDPCAGSGTVLLAAHHTKRRGAAIELDPLYVDTAIRRLVAVSGLSATLADGTSFAEVAAQRALPPSTDPGT